MNSRIWIALPLAAALVLPAAAQTSPTSSDTQNQPAATQSQPANQQQAAPDQQNDQLGPHQPLTQETHEGFWGKINPFARKKYVQRQLTPVRNRVNELDELTATNAKNIKDVDSRAQQGIQLATNKANEADQHAVEAGNRAQQAHQTALDASNRVQTVQQVVTNLDQYKPVTQAEIRFRPGQIVLSQKAKEALDDIAGSLKDQRGYIVEVQGFSAGRGQSAIETSQKMADNVVRYLVINHEVPVYRVHVLGMGNAPVQAQAADEQGKKQQRMRGGRVEISLLKNDLDQLSASNSTGVAASGALTEGGVSGTATSNPDMSQNPQPAASQPATNLNVPSNAKPSAAQPSPKETKQPPVTPHQ